VKRGLAIASAVVVGAILFLATTTRSSERVSFDSARWKAQGPWKDDGKQLATPRLEMIDSLLADHCLWDKTRSEVEELLGRADSEEHRGGETWVWYYVAEADGDWQSDNRNLVLVYGPNEHVARVLWR